MTHLKSTCFFLLLDSSNYISMSYFQEKIFLKLLNFNPLRYSFHKAILKIISGIEMEMNSNYLLSLEVWYLLENIVSILICLLPILSDFLSVSIAFTESILLNWTFLLSCDLSNYNSEQSYLNSNTKASIDLSTLSYRNQC